MSCASGAVSVSLSCEPEMSPSVKPSHSVCTTSGSEVWTCSSRTDARPLAVRNSEIRTELMPEIVMADDGALPLASYGFGSSNGRNW